MKKNLFLITSLFPYGNAETFLETEINYASVFFDKINIIPLNKTLFKRKIPENCFVHDFEIINKWHVFKIITLLRKKLILIEFLKLILKKKSCRHCQNNDCFLK